MCFLPCHFQFSLLYSSYHSVTCIVLANKPVIVLFNLKAVQENAKGLAMIIHACSLATRYVCNILMWELEHHWALSLQITLGTGKGNRFIYTQLYQSESFSNSLFFYTFILCYIKLTTENL